MQLTIEQQRAVALASARLRLESQSQPSTAAPPAPAGTQIEDVLAGVSDVGKGLGKSILKTGLGVSNMLGMVPRGTSMEDIGMETTNTSQKAGSLVGDVGQFFMPGMAASKLGKVGRIAADVVGTGAITAAQTGGDLSAAGEAAGISAAIPVVGKLVSPFANATKTFLSQKFAPHLIDSLIQPAKKLTAFGRTPGRTVAVQGLKANTLEGLEKEIVARKEKIGAEIGSVLTLPWNASKRVDVLKAVNGPIDDAIKAAKIDGNAALVTRLEAFRKGQIVERFGLPAMPTRMEVPPAIARQVKTDVGNGFRWSEDPIEGTLNDVRQKIYRNLNDAIEAQVPGIKAKNATYADLLSAEKATETRKFAASKLSYLPPAAATVGFSMVTAVLTQSVSSTAITAILAGTLAKGYKTTAAKTRLAAEFAKLSPADKTALAKAAPLLRNLYLGTKGDDE